MKTVGSIPKNAKLLLMLLIVAANTAWPVFYLAQLMSIKAEQAFYLYTTTDKQLATIQLNAKQVETCYIIDENELNIGGKMYDVVNHKVINGLHVFSVLADENETALKGAFANVKSQTEKQNTDNSKIVSLFLFYSIQVQKLPVLYKNEIEKSFADYTQSQIHPGYYTIQSPPPKTA